jgi:hypothetical protein
VALWTRGGGEQSGGKGVRQSGNDAVQLTIDYLKQETLEPLKGLGNFVLFGVAGSLLLSIGLVLLLVALLRLLQTETGTTFAGNLSWLPYLIVTAAAILVIALAAWRITKGYNARRRGPATAGASAAEKGQS